MNRDFPNENLLFLTDVGTFLEVAIVDAEANSKMEAFIAKTETHKLLDFLKVTASTKQIDYHRTMMSVEKEDIISMVKGTSPYYSSSLPLLQKYGHYTGGFVDKWSWDHYALERCDITKLLEIYNAVKTIEKKK